MVKLFNAVSCTYFICLLSNVDNKLLSEAARVMQVNKAQNAQKGLNPSRLKDEKGKT